MTKCAERERLLAQKDAAWREFYDLQDSAAKSKASASAQKKVHHLMRALIDHYRKHGCNKTGGESK